MRLLIIGGDARNRHLAELAAARGHKVRLIGHEGAPFSEATPCGHVVMPFPVAEADGFAPTPLSSERLPMEAACAYLKERAVVFATKPGPVLTKYMLIKGCTRIDFMENEAFTVRNAVPSAEGAIYALMQKSPACLSGSHCLIVGYGRIGRALALRLRGLRANVTVAARSEDARANAEADGCEAVTLEKAAEKRGCRFLINTVPAPVVGPEMLSALLPGALAVDLASPPFGIDLAAAKELGVDAWREPGLPGRYAPETAAAAMLSLIEEYNGA